MENRDLLSSPAHRHSLLGHQSCTSEVGSESTLNKALLNESCYAINLAFGENVNMESVGRPSKMK